MLQGRIQRARIDLVDHLLVVGSGKGGVGKSTVTVNLSIALAKHGARVGLLDADAYGPSIPMMLGVRKRGESQGWKATFPFATRQELTQDHMLKPLLRYGIKVMSIGFFIGEEQAVAPIPDVLGVLIRQLLYNVDWGELDYLIVDLPPGNGEPQATLCREIQIDGAILVTTPQDIARIDTAKGLVMFQNAGIPVLGLVQNMRGFVCPHCGERIDIFPPSSESRTLLDSLSLLGSIPIDPSIAVSGDQGRPVVVSMPESPVTIAFNSIAEKVSDHMLAKEKTLNRHMPESKEDSVAPKGDLSNNERED